MSEEEKKVEVEERAEARRDDAGTSEVRIRRKPMRRRKKVCVFCADEKKAIDFKDVNLLKKYVSERGKIFPRRISGNCAKHQRDITLAIKRARHVALMPYTVA